MHLREFGKYRIVKLLPLGGMGRVYLAIDSESNREIALKLIDHGSDPDRQEIVEAERRGAMLQARLCGIDNRITRILSYGDLDNCFFIEMEYVEGQDLSELLTKAPLGVPFAARIGRDICDVLSHAHNFTANIDGHEYHGIVHGDIKPRNIRITPDGQVRVLDFGIAKALSLTRKFTTNHFGSSQYSSPERLNTGDVDIASDIWSVGVVLFEIVTSKPYFEGAKSAKIENAIRNYSAVRSFPQTLPAPFAAILRKALAVNPGSRYRSAAEFGSDLEAFLDGKLTMAEQTPVEDDDTEATRRVLDDEVATRRTFSPPPAAVAPEPTRLVLKAKKPLTQTQRRVRFFAALALLIAVLILTFNEINVWRSGSSLAREVESERLTDMNAAYERLEALSKRNFLPFILSHPRNTIQARLVSSAEGVIREYRTSDSPTVKEADWVRAHDALGKALQVAPGQRELRGKLYLTDGHLSRIRGTARGDSKLLQDARAKFEQSTELIPSSPDPYLGLARLYVYSLRDVDRAEAALKKADKLGHGMGRRERAQLADGFRDRGERLMKEASRAEGLPEEKDLLKRAHDDLERAKDIYRDIVPYASSAVSLRRVLENLETVDERRDEVKDSIWPWR